MHTMDFEPQDQRIEYALLANARVAVSAASVWSGSRAQARYPTTAPTPHAPRDTFGPFGRVGAASGRDDWVDDATTILGVYVFLRSQTILYTLDHPAHAPPALQISALPVSVRRAWPLYPAGVIVQRTLDPDERSSDADELLPTLFSITSPTTEPGVVAEAPSGGIARIRALTASHAANGEPLPALEHVVWMADFSISTTSDEALNSLLLTVRDNTITLWRYACIPERGGLEIRGIWGTAGGDHNGTLPDTTHSNTTFSNATLPSAAARSSAARKSPSEVPLTALPSMPPALNTTLTMADMMEAAERSKGGKNANTTTPATFKRTGRRVLSSDLTDAVDRMALVGQEDEEEEEDRGPRLAGPSSTRLPIPPLRHNDRVSAHVWVEKLARIDMGSVPPPKASSSDLSDLDLSDLSAALFDVRNERGLLAVSSRVRNKVWVWAVGQGQGGVEEEGEVAYRDERGQKEDKADATETTLANDTTSNETTLMNDTTTATSTRPPNATTTESHGPATAGTSSQPDDKAEAEENIGAHVVATLEGVSVAAVRATRAGSWETETPIIDAGSAALTTDAYTRSGSQSSISSQSSANSSTPTASTISNSVSTLSNYPPAADLNGVPGETPATTRPGTPVPTSAASVAESSKESGPPPVAGELLRKELAESAALLRPKIMASDGVVLDLALITAHGELRVLRNPEQVLDVRVVLHDGIPVVPETRDDAMDVDPPTHIPAGPVGQTLKRRLVAVEPGHSGGVGLIWQTKESPTLSRIPDLDKHGAPMEMDPSHPPHLTRTPLRPRLAPRCALTRRIFHALSLALPANIAWRIYSTWACIVFGTHEAGDAAHNALCGGDMRVEREYPAFCTAFCTSLAIPPPPQEMTESTSSFDALSRSSSARRFREDPVLRNMRRPASVNTAPSTTSFSAATDIPHGVLGSALWAVHLVFQELSLMPAMWNALRRLAPLAVAVAMRIRPEWADGYARMCPEDVLRNLHDADSVVGWPSVAEVVALDNRLPGLAPDVASFCLGKLGSPEWNIPPLAIDAFCSDASREYGAVAPLPTVGLVRAIYERLAGGPRRDGHGPGTGIRTLPGVPRPASPPKPGRGDTLPRSGDQSPHKEAKGGPVPRGDDLPQSPTKQATGNARGSQAPSPVRQAGSGRSIRARSPTKSERTAAVTIILGRTLQKDSESQAAPPSGSRSQSVQPQGDVTLSGSVSYIGKPTLSDPAMGPRSTASSRVVNVPVQSTSQLRAEEAVTFMLSLQLPLTFIDGLTLGLAAPIREALRTVQISPPSWWPHSAWRYIGRNDIAASAGDNVKVLRTDGYARIKQLISEAQNRPSIADIAADARVAGAGESKDSKVEAKNSLTSAVEIGQKEFTDVRFGSDRRLDEVGRMLNSSLIPTIRVMERPDLSETDQVKEQQSLAIRVAERTLALPYGRAMFTFATLDSVNRESYQIPKMEYVVRLHPHNLTVSPEQGIVLDSLAWGDFHNGVAAGLRIAPSARGIDSSWIAFNRPDELTAEHAGFLFALGLTGHLRELLTWHTFGYLTPKHDLTSIGILLGLAAANVGTSDSAVTKLLTVHTPALLPTPGVDLNVSLMTQAAGLAGIGVLYLATRNRRMAEVCISQVSRRDLVPADITNEHREAYTYSAALAFGMIMLGKGSGVPADMALVARLNALIHGPDPGMTLEGLPPPTQYDLTLTSPAATIALGLMYLRTGRRDIAALLEIPETIRELEHLQPSFLVLRIVAKALILWDDVQPSQEWLNSQIPATVTRAMDIKAKRTGEHVDDALELAYYNIVAGCCFALGLKYAGTALQPAYKLVVKYYDIFTRLVYTQGVAFEHRIKRSAVRDGLNIISLSLAMIMAGTGEITTLRRFRIAYGMHQQSIYHQGFKYGTHIFNHTSIGLLFLGGGRYTLGTSDVAIASMLVAFFPRFNNMSSDNRSYLQALRHLWVLAIEPRCLIGRDVDTAEVVYLPVKVNNKDKEGNLGISSLIAPTLFPDVETLASIRVDTPRYWPLFMNVEHDHRHKDNLLSTQTIFVKRRSAFLSYIEDPKGSRSLFVRSGSSSGDSAVLDVPQAIDILTHPAADLSDFISSFSNDFLFLAFADHICRDESHTDFEKMFHTYCHAALLDCVLHDKPQTLQAHLTLFQHRQMGCESAYFVLRQLDLRVAAEYYGKLYDKRSSGRTERNYRMPLLREAEVTSAMLEIDRRLDDVRRKPEFVQALRQYVLGQPVTRGADATSPTKELAWYLTRNSVPGTLFIEMMRDLMRQAVEGLTGAPEDMPVLHRGVEHVLHSASMRIAGIVGNAWCIRSMEEIVELWKSGNS